MSIDQPVTATTNIEAIEWTNEWTNIKNQQP